MERKIEQAAAIQAVYEGLWSQAQPALQQGAPQLDPHLQAWQADPRRGLTLIARPSPMVSCRVAAFLREASTLAPGQYTYWPSEMHTTVLTLLVGSAEWRSKVRRWPAFRKVLRDVLHSQPTFRLRFEGICASAGALLIQGYPCDDSLEQLRKALRCALSQHGLGDELDQRFHIITAHLTVMRFEAPLADWRPLLAWVQAHRHSVFGETQVKQLQLVWSDWYMSAERTRVLQTFPLVD